MTTTTIETTLAAIVGAQNIASGGELSAYAVDGVAPKVALFPGDSAEVARVVHAAAAEGLAVLPRGGGTMLSLGRPPERAGVVIGLRRMNRVLEHEPADLTVTVEAGITLEALNRRLAAHGQTLPVDAPHEERATIGGIISANASGPRRLGYGAVRDRLIGIKLVDAHGRVIKGGGKVVKNVAGYDLCKLFTGALGSLGIVIEATFKLAPLPKSRGTLLGAFVTLEDALACAAVLMHTTLRPIALDLLNGTAYRLAAPRAGLPGISERDYFLALAFDGIAAAVERQHALAHKAIAEGKGKPLLIDESGAHDAFWREVVATGRRTDRPSSMITKAATRLSDLARLIHGHEALAESTHLEAGIDAHMAGGVIRTAWWAEGGGPGEAKALSETAATLRKATANGGGTFILEGATTAIKRSIDPWGETGSDFPIMRNLKQQFDPARIMNPGRFVGGL
jgi:glycolate oxidase FAD binding subunit